jgi:hypothetical protein
MVSNLEFEIARAPRLFYPAPRPARGVYHQPLFRKMASAMSLVSGLWLAAPTSLASPAATQRGEAKQPRPK